MKAFLACCLFVFFCVSAQAQCSGNGCMLRPQRFRVFERSYFTGSPVQKSAVQKYSEVPLPPEIFFGGFRERARVRRAGSRFVEIITIRK